MVEQTMPMTALIPMSLLELSEVVPFKFHPMNKRPSIGEDGIKYIIILLLLFSGFKNRSHLWRERKNHPRNLEMVTVNDECIPPWDRLSKEIVVRGDNWKEGLKRQA